MIFQMDWKSYRIIRVCFACMYWVSQLCVYNIDVGHIHDYKDSNYNLTSKSIYPSSYVNLEPFFEFLDTKNAFVLNNWARTRCKDRCFCAPTPKSSMLVHFFFNFFSLNLRVMEKFNFSTLCLVESEKLENGKNEFV